MKDNRSRTYTWNNPLEIFDKAMILTGIDFIKAMFEGEIPPPPIMNTLDFKMSELNEGNVVFEFHPGEYHYNPIGSVHGGVITTILDSAIGCSLHTTIQKNTAYTTLEIKINFLRKITQDTGILKTRTSIKHSGKSTALIESDLEDEAGKVYAHAVSTCMIFKI
ncbi:PaaI family thioesterase [Marinigracilibium pacificum]|uniref:PaaI family thioesterase n=1 Tax=Marinigracilibium pacificum TaxID=2729599 RepID=A0A848J8S8_9BACT|nr:PaaI family thioesterase [Marinigracilibium pacificum]NMM50834.1 PaaI family thioesterase [Marinigracilibium pacificum]